MVGHRMRYAFRPIANAPTCVEKSMRTPDVYATSSTMLDTSVTLRATDPASSPASIGAPGKPGRHCGGRDEAPGAPRINAGCASSCVITASSSASALVLQPHLVMCEVLALVVACPGVGLVVSSPVGPVVGVWSGVRRSGAGGPESPDFVAG